MAKTKIPQKTVKDFYGYDFDSVDTCPEDCWGDYTHANFFKKYFIPIVRKELKKIASDIGATLIFSPSHFEWSAFFQKDGKTIYVSTPDHRYWIWHKEVLFRTAKDEKDYSGGSNHYCSYERLKQALSAFFEEM